MAWYRSAGRRKQNGIDKTAQPFQAKLVWAGVWQNRESRIVFATAAALSLDNTPTMTEEDCKRNAAP
jgi:hypothetical protein